MKIHAVQNPSTIDQYHKTLRFSAELPFSRTRVPVGILFEYLADGHSVNASAEQFPTVSQAQVFALLNHVRKELHKDDGWYSIEDSPCRKFGEQENAEGNPFECARCGMRSKTREFLTPLP